MNRENEEKGEERRGMSNEWFTLKRGPNETSQLFSYLQAREKGNTHTHDTTTNDYVSCHSPRGTFISTCNSSLSSLQHVQWVHAVWCRIMPSKIKCIEIKLCRYRKQNNARMV